MGMRLLPVALAGLLAGCSWLPSWTVGPPYGEDLAVEHHAADPAPSERAAELVEVDGFSSHEACLRRLAELTGEIVTLSPVEARGWRRSEGAVDEYSCAGEVMRRRSWGAAAHH